MSVACKTRSWLLVALVLGLVIGGCQTSEDTIASQSSALSEDQTPPRRSHTLPSQRDWIAPPRATSDSLPYQPGVVVVRWKDVATKASVADGLAAELGLTRERAERPVPFDRMRILTEESVPEVVARLNRDPRIQYAEPNYRVFMENVPNDPLYGDCWGMNNTGQTGGTSDADIDAEEAWDISIGSYDVVVAVLDTGVDYTHEDLAENMWINEDEIEGNGVDDDDNGYIDDVRGWDFENEIPEPMDDYSHGTHCSGIIGAVGNNAVGVAGVSWRVTIMPLRMIGSQGDDAFCADAAEAFHYAVDNGAHVTSNSWWTGGYNCQVVRDAVAYADAADVWVVASCGNGYRDNDEPGFHHLPSDVETDNVIAVAATDHNDLKADFSNWGAVSVDVAAPGVDVLSSVWPSGYQEKSGTSMAGPHVAGTVALMLSIRPDLTKTEVRQFLFNTVDTLPDFQGPYPTVTGGRINVQRVMQAISGVPLPPVALAGGDRTVQAGFPVALDGSSSFDPNQDPITYLWDFYPPSYSSASLDDETSPTPTFTADVCGEYQAFLTVNDGDLDSEEDRARINALTFSPLEPVVASEHDYLPDTNQTWEITQPGAVVMAVHFSDFDTESGYDYVYILDGDDQQWAVYDGDLGEFTSVIVEGNTIKVRLTSDGMVEHWGFEIDEVRWCDAGKCPPGWGDCDDDPGTGTDGCETETTSDLNNCGWCGHVCSFANADATCESGLCVIGACHAGWTDCDEDPQTGCESDVLVDPVNCGECGTVCGPYDNATPGCVGGDCAIGECDAGWDDCDGQLATGCEMDVTSDLANCGSCGNVCDLPNTDGHACVDGICISRGDCVDVDLQPDIETPHPYTANYDDEWVITEPGASQIALHFAMFDVEQHTDCIWDYVKIYDAQDNEVATLCGALGDFYTDPINGDTVRVVFHSDGSVQREGIVIDMISACDSGCADGFSNCDSIAENGCESDTSSDVNNCGGCGIMCGAPHTTSECVDSTCVERQECEPGWADCDNNPANGCEAELATDPWNCGACGIECYYGHAVGVCNSGQCEMGDCNAGWGDCNDDDADGCETSTQFDANNCGACGSACDLQNVAINICRDSTCQVGADCTEHDYAISSAHPYDNYTDETWVITHPGAASMKVHFSDYETESDWDYVYILDGAGNVIASYTGDLGEFWSDEVPGDTIKINLVADSSYYYYGFDIDAYESCISGCDAGWGDCDGIANNGCEYDVTSDVNNCGGCGVVCVFANGTGDCIDGACVVSACDEGFADCNGDPADGCEVDLNNDPENCNTCGNACEYDNATGICNAGTCEMGACDAGFDDCNEDDADGCEIDTDNDINNCGTCGTVCDLENVADNFCSEGECVVPECLEYEHPISSPHPYPDYADLWYEISHPGANRMRVHFSELYVESNYDYVYILDGSDTVITSYTGDLGALWSPYVDGDVIKVVLQSDSIFNYYGFDIDVYEACSPGACDPGWGNCDGDPENGCELDVTADPDNCGGCGIVCNFQNGSGACIDGECVIDGCDEGFADCNGDGTDGCEADLNNDPENCSACGTVCESEHGIAGCDNGMCVIDSCVAPWQDCDNDPTNGCEVDLTTDPDNCGACREICGPYVHSTPGCENSECVIDSCDIGWGDCDGIVLNGCEADVSNDDENCGACGVSCLELPYTTEASCVDNECVITGCVDGWGNCDGNGFNGCESFLDNDPLNCGTCGNACTYEHGVGECSGGSCSLAECEYGWGDCNNDAADGCETHLINDVDNCGGCGYACNLSHASAECLDAFCIVDECDAGFANCNYANEDGCEVNVNDDVENCGACESVCDLDNAMALCVNGGCVVGSCDDGWGNCDGEAANGCEVDLLNTLEHCGECDNACAFDSAGAECVQGSCEMGDCETGYADCNDDSSDGCEIELGSDDDNCGACGRTCGEGQECSNAACVCTDSDGDGYATIPCGDDCDDSNSAINPGSDEVCDDNIDNDCDGATDENCIDEDDTEGGGCGCGTTPSRGLSVLWLALLGLLVLRRKK